MKDDHNALNTVALVELERIVLRRVAELEHEAALGSQLPPLIEQPDAAPAQPSPDDSTENAA
jgi:hypothetical protein